MRARIDFVLPTTGNHGWVVSEGWVKSAEEAKLLGRVFRPKAKWGASEPETDDGLFQQLTDNGLADLVVVLGMDWHSQPLTKLEKWRDAWKNCQSKVVAVIWEDYTSEFVASQETLFNDMVAAASRVIDCVDWIYSNHEDNVYFFQDKFSCQKIGYLPFSADAGIFKENSAFYKVYDKLCFKGFIKSFGFKSGPYAQREMIANQLSKRLGDRFVFHKENVSDQDYAKIISKYFFQINLPSFSPSMTARASEVMAAGGFLFQFEPSGKITNEIFKNGKEMVFYDPGDVDSLIDKIEYYFSHLEEAKSIAKSGQDKFDSQLSMAVQLRYMFSPWMRLGKATDSYSSYPSRFLHGVINNVDLDQVLYPARFELDFGRKCSNDYVKYSFNQLLHISDIGHETVRCDFLFVKSLNRSDYDLFFDDVMACVPEGASYISKDVSVGQQSSINFKALKLFIELRPFYKLIKASNELERACLYIRLCQYYYIYTCLLPIQYRVLVCFADMQPVENLIAQISRSNCLVTVTLQHGMYVDYGELNTVNRVNYEHQPSEYFLAWGGVTADLVRRYHPGNFVLTVGKPNIYANYTQGKCLEGLDYITVIMDQHWYDKENVDMLNLLGEYCATNGLMINVKFHPTNKHVIYEKLGVPYRTDLDMSGSLFVVGHTSSLAYELLVMGHKTYFYRTSAPRLPTDERIVFSDVKQLKSVLSKDYPKDVAGYYIQYFGGDSRERYRLFFASLLGEFRRSM
jgi:hypothetical protein